MHDSEDIIFILSQANRMIVSEVFTVLCELQFMILTYTCSTEISENILRKISSKI